MKFACAAASSIPGLEVGQNTLVTLPYFLNARPELGYNLTALKTSNDRDKFSRGVVEELRGKLPTASVSDLVFHAPAVVAFLWKER